MSCGGKKSSTKKKCGSNKKSTGKKKSPKKISIRSSFINQKKVDELPFN